MDGTSNTTTTTLNVPLQVPSSSSSSSPAVLPPPPTFHQLKACQFSSWYYTFRNLHKNPPPPTSRKGTSTSKFKCERKYPFNNVTIRSIIIKPLPESFIEYLQTDGITLPVGAENVSSFLPDVAHIPSDDGSDCEWSSSSSSSSSKLSITSSNERGRGRDSDTDDDAEDDKHNKDKVESSSEQTNMNINSEQLQLNMNVKKKTKQNDKKKKKDKKTKLYHFEELNDQIQNALDTLGPSIPKLNWSSPKDVTWVNAETMKCSTVGDIYLLLKASDFCTFDLSHALDRVVNDRCDNDNSDDDERGKNTLDYELILRKWSNLHASMEFRCFVSKDEIGKNTIIVNADT